MTSDKANFKYTGVLFASAVLVLAVAALINSIVDPFGMYRISDIEGFNANKPAIYNRVRLLKAYEVRRIKPNSIILGSSRVHLGFNPSHTAWAENYERRYNLAFDGAMTKEMYAYLVHANATGHLQHVILGLDSYHMSHAPGSTRPGFDSSLLMNRYAWLNTARMLAADFKLLISLSTLLESIATVRGQSHADPVWLAQDGQRLGEVFFRRPHENYQRFGPRYYFDEIDKMEIGFKLEWRIPVAPQRQYHPEPPVEKDPITSLGYIEMIIDYCRTHDIDLSIFFTPSHVHQLEISKATGGWPAVENGKRKLVNLIEQDKMRRPDKDPIPVYDFSGYSSITTEPLPEKESRDEMLYYWESSHFKEVVGDMVLDRLLGSNQSGRQVPEDFGVLLTSESIEQVLVRDRESQAAYSASHPLEIQAITAWVENYKHEHGIVD